MNHNLLVNFRSKKQKNFHRNISALLRFSEYLTEFLVQDIVGFVGFLTFPFLSTLNFGIMPNVHQECE
ncbi:hypothetical protein BZL35_00329 [Candidatus Pandoraea novymonadis]|uniref:Uncharacterized protein n=1 Tax=Candidatus Pandoraea novymonadis TaxID=1808959 RepID=A0ABX5FGJ8_9BURK|nr:hypothetical protein BZL35_00329 [Candidatus Pandoraea novymonadis]